MAMDFYLQYLAFYIVPLIIAIIISALIIIKSKVKLARHLFAANGIIQAAALIIPLLLQDPVQSLKVNFIRTFPFLAFPGIIFLTIVGYSLITKAKEKKTIKPVILALILQILALIFFLVTVASGILPPGY
jgi:hypothetical protein